MPGEIILLTGEREGPYLADHLKIHKPDLRVVHLSTRAALNDHFRGPGKRPTADLVHDQRRRAGPLHRGVRMRRL